MLHIVEQPYRNASTTVESGIASGSDTIVSNISHGSHAERATQVFLSTAIIEVFDSRGRVIVTKALLDSGSQSCFVTYELAQRLRVKQEPFDVPIVGINQTTTRACRKVRAVDCVILNNITQNIPAVSVKGNDFKIPDNIKLADPTFFKSSRIDILLGVEVFYDLLCVGQIKATRSHPCLQKSHLGWLVSGRALVSGYTSPTIVCNVVAHNKDLDHMIARFWELEGCSTSSVRTQQEKDCEVHFISNHTRNAEGRFIVKLPIKNDKLHELGDNRSIALKHFYSLERKLNKQPDLKREYCDFIKEYEDLGHIRAVTDSDETATIKYYMPHHAVLKQSSLTTKLRVVFDASCKSQTGASLNDLLAVGPNLQEDLFSIITRFRTHRYVITAAVAKMYRQVLVDRSQTSLQRILWRDDEGKALSTYELLTVTYGTAPASFLATRCLHEIANLERGSSPIGAMIIQRDFYVDGLLTGANSITELIHIRDEVIGILSRAGFVLRKWASNIAESSQGLQEQSESESSMLLTLNKEDDIWTLGVQWNPNKDSFQYFVPASNSSRRVTKRSILASVARVFDPLGLIGLVTVTAKILVQRLWQLGLGWDESIPVALHTRWSRYEEQLPMLNNVRLDRHVVCKDATRIEMHGFSDASENAYGACVYIVSYDACGNTFSRLLCAKSRVAPLKVISLPRLELCGALLLARLINKLNTVLCLSLARIQCWSDSANVLAWLKSPSRAWTTFVANRVSEIQELTPVSYWGHVPSAQNPADVISRGVTPAEILNLAIWWEGPISFIQGRNDAIPEIAPEEIPERRSASIVCAISTTNCFTLSREFSDFIFNRFSSFVRLTRVIAYVIRFAHNGRNVNNRITGPLTNLELGRSRTCLVKMCQALAFESEIQALLRGANTTLRCNISSLDPFIDNDGIVRVGGRLQNSRLRYDGKHPILLPKSHPLTVLIIEHEHRKYFHAGPQLTLAAVRSSFWPKHGRSVIRRVIRKCVTCFKNAPTNSRYLMGNLPEPRVTPSRPFSNTGVDYCGPFLVKEGRRRNSKLLKSYVAIFVSMAIKAVHIELVTDMSTDCFISCLKRFMARRPYG